MSNTRKYAIFGAVFGLCFPLMGIPIEAITRYGSFGAIGIGKRIEELSPGEAGSLQNQADRHEALVIGHLHGWWAQSHEAAFELLERQPLPVRPQPAPRGLWVRPFEVLREPLVQPGRNAPRRDGRDDRVRQLVREHALEQLGLLRRARRRYANPAVVAGP